MSEDFFGMCHKCGDKVIGEGNGCSAMGEVYHVNCFTCAVCSQPLRGKQFYAINISNAYYEYEKFTTIYQEKPYCEDDYLDTLEKCSVCNRPIIDRILRATGKPFHPDCFRCEVCSKVLDNVPFTVSTDGKIHCIEDFHKKFAPRCSVCKEPIVPEPGKQETVRVVALDRSFHVDCYRCEDCDLQLSSEAEGHGCYPLDGHILCKGCNTKRVQDLASS